MTAPSYASEPQIQLLHQLIADIAEGHLQVPMFERPLVWTAEQKLELLRSVRSGLPIGSIMVWRTTRQDIRAYNQLGPHALPIASGPVRTYLLDGLQRLSTLFAALHPRAESDGTLMSGHGSWNFYYDLERDDFLLSDRAEDEQIRLPLWLMLDTVRLIQFQRQLNSPHAIEFIRAADALAKRLWNYKLPIIPLSTDSLEDATRAFVRINSQGTPMSEVHMLAALTYREDFDLRQQVARVRELLAQVNWDSVSEELIVATCTAVLGLTGEAISRIGDALLRHTEVFDQVAASLRQTAEFLSKHCRIESPLILPCEDQAAWLATFLSRDPSLDEKSAERLATRLWLTTYFPGPQGELLDFAPQAELLDSLDLLQQHHDFRTARGKALAMRLAEKEPRSSQNEPLPAFSLLATEGERAFTTLLPIELLPQLLRKNPGNYIITRPNDLLALRKLIVSDSTRASSELLASHAISNKALAALREGNYVGFVLTRKSDLDEIEREFVASLLLRAQLSARDASPPQFEVPKVVLSKPNAWPAELTTFFAEYLGSADNPAPFGGRESQLAELKTWLLDSASPPYALVTAEAGCGKSALLAQFAELTRTEGRVDVIFVPVSIRFGTALRADFMRLLLGQIGRLRTDSRTPPREIEALRMEAQASLTSESPGTAPLLVVIDGLDEAEPLSWRFGPDFFLPETPGRGVKLLLAARKMAGRNWTQALGLQRSGLVHEIKLPALDESAVQEVLGSTMPQLLAQHPQLPGRLFALSQGDPLLLRLCLDELMQRKDRESIDLTTLSTWKPGLDAYLYRMVEEQRLSGTTPLDGRGLTDELLSLLACALGPLDLADLVSLVQTTQASPTAKSIQVALSLLGRLVIGDGRTQGYVFSHPRLRDYFANRLDKRKKLHSTSARLLTYCQSQLAHVHVHPDSKKISNYAVRHLGAHLEALEAEPEAYYAMLQRGWLFAWYGLDGTYEGFLGDVHRAWRQADSDGKDTFRRARAIEMQLRCALLTASIQGLTSNLPGKFLAALVREKLWSPENAIGHVRCMAVADERGEALAALAPYLQVTQLNEALDLARRLTFNVGLFSLSALFPLLSENQQAECLREVLSQPHTRWTFYIEHLLPSVAPTLLSMVFAAALKIHQEYERCSLLAAILPHLSGIQRTEAAKALRDTAMASPAQQRLHWLLRLAKFEAGSLRAEVIGTAWQELAAWPETADYPAAELAELFSFLLYFPEAIRFEIIDKARRIAQFPEQENGHTSLEFLAVPLVQVGHGAEVLDLIANLRHAFRRPQLCARISSFLDPGLREVALEQIRACRTAYERGEALALFASSVPDAQAEELIDEVINLHDSMGSPIVPTFVLRSLVPHLRGHRLAKVKARILKEKTSIGRAQNLSQILPCLDESDRVDVLIEILGELKISPRGTFWRHLLSSIVPYLSRSNLEQALTIALQLSDRETQINVALQFAAELAKNQESERALNLVSEALDDKRFIPTATAWLFHEVPVAARSQQVKLVVKELRAQPTSGVQLVGLIRLFSFQQETSVDDRAREVVCLLESIELDKPSREYIFSLLYSELGKLGGDELLRDQLWARLAPDEDRLRNTTFHLLTDQIALRHIPQALSWTRSPGYLDDAWIDLVRRMAALGQVTEALQEARSLTGMSDAKCDVLIGILKFLKQPERRKMIQEIKELLKEISEPDKRAELLAGLLPHLPKKERQPILQEIFGILLNLSPYQEATTTLSRLSPHLAHLPLSDLFEKWSSLLHALAKTDRQRLLRNLEELAPAANALGSSDLLLAAAQSILDVGTWIQ